MTPVSSTVDSTPAGTSLFGKLRALARRALELHLQHCEVLAEAYRRPR